MNFDKSKIYRVCFLNRYRVEVNVNWKQMEPRSTVLQKLWTIFVLLERKSSNEKDNVHICVDHTALHIATWTDTKKWEIGNKNRMKSKYHSLEHPILGNYDLCSRPSLQPLAHSIIELQYLMGRRRFTLKNNIWNHIQTRNALGMNIWYMEFRERS
jgi:hypothetical protein